MINIYTNSRSTKQLNKIVNLVKAFILFCYDKNLHTSKLPLVNVINSLVSIILKVVNLFNVLHNLHVTAYAQSQIQLSLSLYGATKKFNLEKLLILQKKELG